jgi:serine/threonine-protein kinase
MKRIVKILKIIIIFIISVVIIVESFMIFMSIFVKGGEIKVPDFTGMEKEIALKRIKRLGLKSEISFQEDANFGYNQIIIQDPLPNEVVKRKHKVKLLVSSGIGKVEVPDLTDMNIENAEVVLENNQLQMGEIRYVRNNYSAQNQILAQNLEPKQIVEKGTYIDLVVNRGPDIDYVYVLDFTGQSYRFIADIIQNLGLRCSARGRGDRGATDGTIIAQNIAPGKIVSYDSIIVFDIEQIKTEEELTDIQKLSKGETATETTEEVEEEIRAKNVFISYIVPEGFIKRNLRIVVKDYKGKRTIFKGKVKPGERIEKITTVVGKYKIFYYLDGKLVKVE